MGLKVKVNNKKVEDELKAKLESLGLKIVINPNDKKDSEEKDENKV